MSKNDRDSLVSGRDSLKIARDSFATARDQSLGVRDHLERFGDSLKTGRDTPTSYFRIETDPTYQNPTNILSRWLHRSVVQLSPNNILRLLYHSYLKFIMDHNMVIIVCSVLNFCQAVTFTLATKLVVCQ